MKRVSWERLLYEQRCRTAAAAAHPARSLKAARFRKATEPGASPPSFRAILHFRPPAHLLATTNQPNRKISSWTLKFPIPQQPSPKPPNHILKPYHLSPHTPSTTPSPPLNHHHAPPHLPNRRLHSHLHRPLPLPPHASALTRPSSIPPSRIRAPARLPLLPYIDIFTYSNKLSRSAVAG